MQSFRTELENPIVERDIIDLERKIQLFREGKIHDEKFRSLRLARGIYGQRQPGVQMIRIKIPFGKLNTHQLLTICDISEEYSRGNLHLTTRQDIQIHFVSLDRTPELWARLEADDITLREACGNAVRNVTAPAIAGIDPEEPFDVSPYAHAFFKYFLRNPISQELGRKFKVAFSTSERDLGLSYMHDLGFIPKIKIENGVEKRGFKVMIGGGLGAQPFLAHLAHDFLAEEKILPYSEAVVRVFDRHGERNNRNKARLKYLINKIGFEAFQQLVEAEWNAVKNTTFPIDLTAVPETLAPAPLENTPSATVADTHKYDQWLRTNVVEQKQKGFFSVGIKVLNGDLPTKKARVLAQIIRKYAADDARVTIHQNLLLKFVRPEYLNALFNELNELGLAEAGFEKTADVTSCPGTDSCNLAISNSTGITRALEKVIIHEYADFIENSDIKIKISGCMNACGQHAMAQIGFHGSSLRTPLGVIPSLQVLLGGGTVGDGAGRVSDKVIKVPSKRGTDVLRKVLDVFEESGTEGEYFNDFYDRIGGKDYFYHLLKPLADITNLTDKDYYDWEHEEKFKTEIGIGECAGVQIDLVATLLYESEEKLSFASEALDEKRWADSIYHSYAVFISTAKALLLDKGVHCNTQTGILNDFETHFASAGFHFKPDFKTMVLNINKYKPTESFAKTYFDIAASFTQRALKYKHK